MFGFQATGYGTKESMSGETATGIDTGKDIIGWMAIGAGNGLLNRQATFTHYLNPNSKTGGREAACSPLSVRLLR